MCVRANSRHLAFIFNKHCSACSSRPSSSFFSSVVMLASRYDFVCRLQTLRGFALPYIISSTHDEETPGSLISELTDRTSEWKKCPVKFSRVYVATVAARIFSVFLSDPFSSRTYGPVLLRFAAQFIRLFTFVIFTWRCWHFFGQFFTSFLFKARLPLLT